ncbi:MAG: hypothetical protein ACLFVQ_11635 [Chitinispirillaceae bacterium]
MGLVAIAVTILLSAASVMSQIQPVVTDNQGNGSIDWSERCIIATGIGAPNPNLPQAAQRPAAIRAAQQIALRNALETVKGINLNSSTRVENFMVEQDIVSSSVSGFVKGFQQEGKTKYMSDGSVEVTMKVPLDGIGGIGEILLDSQLRESPMVHEVTEPSQEKMMFTGLIIDCRGLKVKPALSPRILDKSGKEVYGSAYVSREWAIKHGIVGYSKDINAAAKLDRSGDSPGKIKAVKTSGDNKTDVVISNKDANDVRSAADNLKFLSECRVILVID